MQLFIGTTAVEMSARQLLRSIFASALKRILPDRAFSIYRPSVITGAGKYGLSQADVTDSRRFYQAFRSLCYACIDARAKDVATAVRKGKMKLYRKQGQTKTLIEDHPVYQLIDNPNPSCTRWFLWYLIETYLCMFGNAYIWLKVAPNGEPVAMWLLPPSITRIVPGNPAQGEEIIKGYTVSWPGSEPVYIQEHEVVHLRLPNPSDPYYYGQSLMYKAAVEIDVDQFIAEMQRDYFAIGGTPAGVVVFPSVLEDEQRRFFEESFVTKFQGKPGQIGVLEGGAEYVPVVSQKELDYLESRGVNRKTIQAVFGVPDSRLGFTEQITATATLETVDAVYLRSTIEPELTLIDEQLTLDFVRKYYGDDLLLEHEDVVPKDARKQKELDKMDLEAGRVSINYLNERDGLPLVEGGDQPLVSMGLVPLASLAAGEATNQPEKSLSEAQKRATWQKANTVRETWRKRYQLQLKSYFQKIKRDVVQSIIESPKAVGLSLTIDLDEWLRLLVPIARRNTALMIKAGFEEFIANHTTPQSMVWAENHPSVRSALQALVDKTKTVPRTLHGELMRELNEGISKHESVQELAHRAAKFFDLTMDYRAMRIAKTVSVAAINCGNQIAAKRSGIYRTKMWLSMRDDRVRDGHYELDGKRVGIDEPFIEPETGDRLMYPGDPMAVHGESVINCRCVLVYGR